LAVEDREKDERHAGDDQVALLDGPADVVVAHTEPILRERAEVAEHRQHPPARVERFVEERSDRVRQHEEPDGADERVDLALGERGDREDSEAVDQHPEQGVGLDEQYLAPALLHEGPIGARERGHEEHDGRGDDDRHRAVEGHDEQLAEDVARLRHGPREVQEVRLQPPIVGDEPRAVPREHEEREELRECEQIDDPFLDVGE
jgi:hypothetical protein